MWHGEWQQVGMTDQFNAINLTIHNVAPWMASIKVTLLTINTYPAWQTKPLATTGTHNNNNTTHTHRHWQCRLPACTQREEICISKFVHSLWTFIKTGNAYSHSVWAGDVGLRVEKESREPSTVWMSLLKMFNYYSYKQLHTRWA